MEIVWTDEAIRTFNNITDHILHMWSIKELTSFIDKTEEVINLIEQHNEVGMVYKKTAYRQFLVSKQTYLFYKIVIGNPKTTVVYKTNRQHFQFRNLKSHHRNL